MSSPRLKFFSRELVRAEELSNPFLQGIVISCLAFPDDENSPAFPAQLMNCVPVSPGCCLKLGFPESGSSSRHGIAASAIVSMPKAPMDEDDTHPSREHEIGTARKIVSMKAVAIPEIVCQSSYRQLRSRVAVANPAHVLASLFLR